MKIPLCKGGELLKTSIIHFVISAIIGLGLGYLVYDIILDSSDEDTVLTQEQATDQTAAVEEEDEEVETPDVENVSNKENILQTKGCIGCHAVEGLNLQGGVTGPDLSKAYSEVEGKHGKPLQEFLKEPTSAVMSSVIGGSPLSAEEIDQIVEELKKAAEQ
jgi:mono/diheme cytochrome c family protein